MGEGHCGQVPHSTCHPRPQYVLCVGEICGGIVVVRSLLCDDFCDFIELRNIYHCTLHCTFDASA